MASFDDIRCVALSYPGVVEGDGPQRAFGLTVKGKAPEPGCVGIPSPGAS